MNIVRVLKRKDAASVVVAILVALIMWPVLQALTTHIASWLSGVANDQYFSTTPSGVGWKGEYAYPVISAILELIVLELFIWIYAWLAEGLKTSKKK